MRRLLFTLALLVLPVPLAAQDGTGAANPPNIVVRQSADPATGAVVGQRIALYVDVFFRDAMPRPPRVSLPDVPGLQNFRFETQGLTERETIAGADYVGQRFEFALYARRGGTFELPAAAVTLLDRQGAETGRTQGAPVRLEVTVPPGVDLSRPVVATRRLTLREQWEPAAKHPFKAGDAIVRTITRTADDVPGLAMRDLAFSAPEGIRTYADPPDIDDHIERGVVTGRRVDRVTYVFERGGAFVLPAMTQPWWDLSAGALKIGDAAGATIDVSAAPASGSASNMTGLGLLLVLVVGAALLVALALGFVFRRRRYGSKDAEREAFASLRRACATADAVVAYRAFAHWGRFLVPERRAEAVQAAAPLSAALFAGRPSTWDVANSTEFVKQLMSIRGKSHSMANRNISLPPLNPRPVL
jgi:hypothetical protein